MAAPRDIAKSGRPRNEDADTAILKAALFLVSSKGYRSITVDQIAARAKVGKMSIYRRYPSKAAIVMDALLQLIGHETDFPVSKSACESIRLQLHLQIKFFRSKYGTLIRSLLAEAQSNEELANAFRERWIAPRRRMVMDTLQKAVSQGQLHADFDLETAIDSIYGPIYYRLLLGTGELTLDFADEVYNQFISGHGQSQ